MTTKTSLQTLTLRTPAKRDLNRDCLIQRKKKGGGVFNVAEGLRITELSCMQCERLSSDPGHMVEQVDPAGESNTSTCLFRRKHPARQRPEESYILEQSLGHRQH